MKLKKFYSGFYLHDEFDLFKDYIEKSDFIFSAFSYGCIRLLEDLNSYDKRVDKIQLFSPAYFGDKDDKFKNMQLKMFEKNEKLYIENFLKNCAYPSEYNLINYVRPSLKDDLEKLLFFDWNEILFQKIFEKRPNLEIEIFLGEKDKIISSNIAADFFRRYGNVYFFKEVGHIITKK
jgi:hypothetical protein